MRAMSRLLPCPIMKRIAKAASPEGATHRLEDMLTSEVSLVDLAANLRKFVSIKEAPKMAAKKAAPPDDGKDPKKDPKKKNPYAAKGDEGSTEKQMALPAEAKQSLIEGVNDALEKLVGVTQALKESTIDDGAEVPPELATAIKDAGDALAKVASKYSAGDAEGEKPPAKPAATSEDANDDAKAPAAKARRLTPNRVAAITAARDQLTALLEATADAPAADDSVEPPAPAPAAKSDDSKIVDALLKLAEKVEQIGKSTEKKADDAAAAVAKLRADLAAPGTSRAQSPEGEPAPVAKSVQWPDDMNDWFNAPAAGN